MRLSADIARQIISALDEPALIVSHGRTIAGNGPARSLFGQAIEGADVRLAIRHPDAVPLLMSNRPGEVELTGIGGADRPWHLTARSVGPDQLLIRLEDRSAAISAERMRTDFVANASHELRTPLATVIGYAETLAEDGPVPDEMRARFGKTIELEARRMSRIVEDLMSLSRIEADRYRAPGEPVAMDEVARVALEQVNQLADRRGCTVKLEIAEKVAKVPGDFSQLLQLTDNLVANAIRYGCNAHHSTVTVSVESQRGRTYLTVRDQGDGIAPEHLPRLTERFYRVDPARSRNSGGTGLGLAIVKHIVERHRGTIAIQSRPGEGTQVTVSLPAI